MKKVQITQELFVKLVQYHIFGIYDAESEIKKGIGTESRCLVKKKPLWSIQNCTDRVRTRTGTTGISGQYRNPSRL